MSSPEKQCRTTPASHVLHFYLEENQPQSRRLRKRAGCGSYLVVLLGGFLLADVIPPSGEPYGDPATRQGKKETIR